MFMSARRAFTFIELLICLALVAMVAALAVPNFTEARVSSDVALAKTDLQLIKQGLETYKVDRGAYPWMNGASSALNPLNGSSSSLPTLERLTTPVAYLSDLPYLDVFQPQYAYEGPTLSEKVTADTPNLQWVYSQYFYHARNLRDTSTWGQNTYNDVDPYWYFLESAGPDRAHNYVWMMINTMSFDTDVHRARVGMAFYDPTNGSVSRGSIWELGGEPQGYATSMAYMIEAANSAKVCEWKAFE